VLAHLDRGRIVVDAKTSVRALFCFGVLEPFYDLDDATRKQVFDKLLEAYSDLKGRFGVTVLGTLDDDRFVVGPTLGWPWTCYILAEAPDYDSVAKVCDILREFSVGEHRIWRYMKVEARTGRELFFGRA
jgi:hypothetical protein